MGISTDVVFQPLPLGNIIDFPFPPILNPLGPLQNLPGTWTGTGFNTIWRPNHPASPQDRFLELNLTDETLEFTPISGPIPNRGLLQPDINMFGMTYMQQISDHNLGAGLHVEPGIWAVVPPTADPAEGSTVVRMASIPHGTTILAQGVSTVHPGPPNILPTTITPTIGGQPLQFPEVNLAQPTAFRSPAAQIAGITQDMVNDPNKVLRDAIAGQTILSTTELKISTLPVPVLGGGTANTAFLQGGPDGPNAVSASVTATFWIELVQGSPNFWQLQYTQTVDLVFNGPHWPHVTVGTLRKKAAPVVPIWKINPFQKIGPVAPGPGPVEHPQPGRAIPGLGNGMAALRVQHDALVQAVQDAAPAAAEAQPQGDAAPAGADAAAGGQLDEAAFVARAEKIAEESQIQE